MISSFNPAILFVTLLLLSQPLLLAASNFEEAPNTPDTRITDPARSTPTDPSAPVDPTAPTDPSSDPSTLPAQGNEFATLLLCLVNKERTSNNLKPLGLDARLVQASQGHSEDQARRRTMTHDGEDGSTPGKRVTKEGLSWRAVGENVAYGYRDMVVTMKEWMDSPGHRANILNSKYTMFGGAVAYNGRTPYYTQDFAFDGSAARNVPASCPEYSSSAYTQMPGSGADATPYKTTPTTRKATPATPKKVVRRVKKQPQQQQQQQQQQQPHH